MVMVPQGLSFKLLQRKLFVINDWGRFSQLTNPRICLLVSLYMYICVCVYVCVFVCVSVCVRV